MMQNDEIQHIGDVLRTTFERNETVFDVVKKADGQTQVSVTRQELPPVLPPHPERLESPPRAHIFYAVSGFIDYLRRYGSAATVVFADAAGANISAVLDETAEEGFEIVQLVPQYHPRWLPWARALDRSMELDTFIDLLRNNRRAVVGGDTIDDPRELVLALSQISAATETTLHRGKGAKALNGLLIRTKIQGQLHEEPIELPERLKLHTPVYVDEPARDIELDLVIEAANESTIVARFASADIREAMISAFDAMVDRLRTELSEADMTVTHGKPSHGLWGYIRD
jgi:hypothetical protein